MQREIDTIIYQLRKAHKIRFKQGQMSNLTLTVSEIKTSLHSIFSDVHIFHLDENDLRFVGEMKNLEAYEIQIESWENTRELEDLLHLVRQEMGSYQRLLCHIAGSLKLSLSDFYVITSSFKSAILDDGDFVVGLSPITSSDFSLRLFIWVGYEG